MDAWTLDASYGGVSDENELAALNVAASPKFTLFGSEIDATDIIPELPSDKLHEADGVESNVATGYHAIECMLWGKV